MLVSQYRPPVAVEREDKGTGLVLEMPAGLIDAGEEGDEGTKKAALRELKEETGYGNEDNKKDEELEIIELSPLMHNDPGSEYIGPCE